MVFIRRVLVGDQERVLVIRKGRFERVLVPGEYWLFGAGVDVERRNVSEMVYTGAWAPYIVNEPCFTVAETTDTQVAVVAFEGKLTQWIGPGRRVLYWKGPIEVRAEVFDVRENVEIPAALIAALTRLGRDVPAVFTVVDEGKTGLLFVDGKLVRTLAPGTYGFWTAAGAVRVDQIDLRLQTLEIPGQEILTKDKVSIRVNVWAEYRVTDAMTAKTAVKDYAEHLYRAVQLAVRQTLGQRTLEEILADKTAIDEKVAGEVRSEMEAFGVRVGGMALKDIVLPGEMREILNQVVTAEKQAQANLIRRREETAATRSLLNTAKLMEDNPLLVRLKELETLEKVAEKVGKITVHGGFEGLQKLVALK